jgi:hypothetical protein
VGNLVGRRAVLLAVVLAGGAVLGACSSSPKPVTHHHAPPTSTSTSTPTSTSTSSTSTVPTTSVETTCSTGLLGITAAPGGVAAGTSYIVFTLTNRGPTRCTLEGFPSLEFFGPSGASGAGAGPKLSITPMDGGEAPGLVTLASDGTAEFIVVINDVPVGGVGCSTVASVDVAIPGTGEALAVPVTMTPCGGSVTVDAFDAPGSESP